MGPKILFNCCENYSEPDWTQFTNLELGGCIDAAEEGSNDTVTEGGIDRHNAQFFSIYGRLVEGGCDVITDCLKFEDAECIGRELQKLSGLPLEIVC